MKNVFRVACFGVLALLPSRVKIVLLNRFFGCSIHPSAVIGFSYIDVKRIDMGEKSTIGSLNIIKNLELLSLGEYARIGRQNYISALPLGCGGNFTAERDRFPALIIGRHAAVTGRHYLDCNNCITLGSFSLVAGLGCTFLSHGIDVKNNVQETQKIVVGDYCMIGANATLVKGSKLPSFSILAAGSVLHKAHEATHKLYSGVPAVAVRDLSEDSKFFTRESGVVRN